MKRLLLVVLVVLGCSEDPDDRNEPGLDETEQAVTTATVRYKYTGKEQDATGLYYYGARYYDPRVGRFGTADTVLPDVYDPQQLNRYAYARNNPIRLVDPDGHSPALVIGAAIGAGVDYATQVWGNAAKVNYHVTWDNIGGILTSVDLRSIAVSAALGATSGGTSEIIKETLKAVAPGASKKTLEFLVKTFKQVPVLNRWADKIANKVWGEPMDQAAGQLVGAEQRGIESLAGPLTFEGPTIIDHAQQVISIVQSGQLPPDPGPQQWSGQTWGGTPISSISPGGSGPVINSSYRPAGTPTTGPANSVYSPSATATTSRPSASSSAGGGGSFHNRRLYEQAAN
jgi:RHS repeat-associated protein